MAACKYTLKDIGHYLLNRMTPEEETEFQYHLHECEKCRIQVEEMRRLADGLREEQESTPVHIRQRKEKIKSFYLVRIAVAVAAMFIIGYMITLTFDKQAESMNEGLQPGMYHQADTVTHTQDTSIINKDSILEREYP